jgi:ABC-2 type transport system ATP-binding protein
MEPVRAMKITARPHILCENIGKNFGRKNILRDVSLEVPPGKIMAIVGPNGAGKTTFLKILATLVEPSDGDARINGFSVRQDPARVRQVIGYISAEERSFYWRLNGIQNLRFFAAMHGIHGRQGRDRICRALNHVGLAERAKERVRNYSSGMKQVLGIARGILHDPLVLLMDEPTRSLSPELARKIRNLIKRMAAEDQKAILLSSHNLTEVEDLADCILMLDRGCVKAQGTMAELRKAAALGESASLDDVFHHYVREEN